MPVLKGPLTIDGEVIDPMEIIDEQHRTDDRIFPFSTAKTSTAFTRGATACGINDLRFHDLRHHAVSLLFEHGFRIEQVALVSGHQDWKMLRRYTHIDAASLHNHEAAQ